MSRPRSESEYLARLIPPSVAGAGLSRRGFLKGTLGAGAAVSLSSLLAACGGGDDNGGSGGSASQEVTFGSNQSDAVPKKAYADMLAASGMTVKVNTVDHNTFQENINNYLQGNPDDVFTWFAGYRMRFFAAQGLAGDISDVWGGLSGMSEAFKQASTGDDGKQYFVPLTTYPWALFYRKSVWEEKGYEPPKTLDELVTLSKQMQKDGLVPIAFADKDGWPAMGTFDQLNMRINGYQFHVDLMAGKKAWDSPEVKKVFDTWKGLLPYHQEGALGRTWQEAAQSLLQEEVGHVPAGHVRRPAVPRGQGAGRPRLLRLPRDRPGDRHGRDRGPDRRLHDARPSPRTRQGPSAAQVPRHGQGRGHRPQGRPDRHRGQQRGRHRLLHRPAEEGGRVHRLGRVDRPVPGPRHPARLRLHGDASRLQTFLKNPNDIDGLTKSLESQKKSIFTS